MRLVHSTENACKNGDILNFKKSKDPSNHVAARGRELVSLVSLNKSHKIDQINKINWLSLVVLRFVVRGLPG